ncbi:MAG: beta-lactamase family protein [Chitinophagaceae bacterium]|nr:beta-lactamase family protein [Chitinophagaceae bacterium]
MLQKTSLLLLLLLIMIKAEAQKTKSPPAKANTASASNHQLQKKLDSIFSSYNKSTPGVAVTILQNGKVIAKNAYGMASLEFSVPFTHNTLVRLPYSEGREFISIAAALMEKDGMLHLNDNVKNYFPKLPAWSDVVTIQDLLNHSSGFADEWATLALTQASMANRLDKSQFLQFLYNQPEPSVEPQKGYMYSNSDFGLLRLILEKAAGEDLAAYMKRKVFDSLKMIDTRIHNDKEAVIANRAFTYNIDVGNSYKLWLQDKTSPGGNYFVLTSANDLEKWAAAHADSKSFISAAVNRLKQNARPIPVIPGTNYVFGQKHRKIGSYDAIVHMGVSELPYIAYIPEQNLTVILLSNLFLSRWNSMEKVLSSALGLETQVAVKSNFSQQPIEVDPEELKKFAGTYKWKVPLTYQSYVERKRFTEFVSENRVLKVLYSSEDTLDLVPVAKNTFRDPEYPDVFVFAQKHADSAMKVVMYTYDGDTIRMEKVLVTKPNLAREQLQKFTGNYYSRHLDFYWTLVLNENNQLVVKRPTIADKRIEPTADGEFRLMMDYGPYESESWIRFYFTDNGSVSYFTISHPRLMGHRFDKVQ